MQLRRATGFFEKNSKLYALGTSTIILAVLNFLLHEN